MRWPAFRVSALLFIALSSASSETPQGRLVDRQFTSTTLAENKIGTSPERKMAIYLPPGYDTSPLRYPVIYFLPNPFEESFRFDFDHRDAQGLFDRAIAGGVIGKFILVAIDMNTPLGSSWYANSSVTGNWENFIVEELVPYIDANFKTLPNRRLGVRNAPGWNGDRRRHQHDHT